MDLFVELSLKGDKDLEKRLAALEKKGASTEKSLGGVSKSLQGMGTEASRAGDGMGDLDSSLSRLGKTSKGASGGLSNVAHNIRDIRTVAVGAAGIPALVAAIGGLAPVATAAAGATAQLALGLGQAAAGFGLIGGTAVGGAVAGLKAYSAGIQQTISDSRTAYQAINEQAAAHLELARNQKLNTQESVAFNQQIDASILRLTDLEAAVGSRVFPGFTQELSAWTGLLGRFQPKVVDTAGALGVVATKFSEFVRTADKGRLLGDIFDFINRSAVRGAQALSEMGQAGLSLFRALIPDASALQDRIVNLTISINRWVQSAEGAKRIDGIIGLLNTRMNQAIAIGKNLGLALVDIFRSLNATGQVDAMMRGLVGLTGQFRELVRFGGEGSQAIQTFMRNAQPVLTALGRLAGEAAKQFLILSNNLVKPQNIGALVGVINGLKNSLVPLRQLFQETFVALGPIFARLIPQVAEFARTFLGSSGPLVVFLNTVTRLLTVFNNLPAPIKNAVASFVAFRTIMSTLGLSGAISGFAGLVTQIVTLRAASSAAAAAQGALAASTGASGAAAAASAGKWRMFGGALGALKFTAVGAGIAGVDIGLRMLLARLEQTNPSLVRAAASFDKASKSGKGFSGFMAQMGRQILEGGGPVTALARRFLDLAGAQNRAGQAAKGAGDSIQHSGQQASQGFSQMGQAGQSAFNKISGGAKKTAMDVRNAATSARREGVRNMEQLRVESSRSMSTWNKDTVRTMEDMRRQSSLATERMAQEGGRSFDKLQSDVANSTNSMKTDVSKNTGIMRSSMAKNNQGMESDTKTKFTSMAGTIGQKSIEAKTKQGAAWGQMRTKKASDETAMENNTKARFTGMANAVSTQSWDAEHAAESAWGKLRTFVEGVLNALNLGGGTGDPNNSTASGNPRQTSGGMPVGARAKGGIDYAAEGGGFRRARQPQHIVWGEGPADEAAIFVTKDRKHRKDNEKYAGVAASLLGGMFIPEHQKQAMGFASGGTLPVSALSAEQQKAANAVEQKFPETTQNTYVGHPGGASNSFDTWGSGGRGSPIGSGTGDAVSSFLKSNFSPFNWLIWKGMYQTMSGSKPYWDQSDMHYDHVHFTRGSSLPGFSVGGASMPNPLQLLFDRLWKPVQGFADGAVRGIKAISPFNLVQAAGDLTAQKVGGIHDAIDARIPDMIGGPSGTGSAGLKGQSSAKGGSPAQNRAMGEKMLAASGVAGSWGALDALWNKESGWNRFADNPISSAYGIPQNINPSSYPSGGSKEEGSHAGPQIDWGLGYIKGRYGSTDNAWAHSQSTGWYHTGGLVRGKRGQNVPAVLQAGEAVIPAAIVRAFASGGVLSESDIQAYKQRAESALGHPYMYGSTGTHAGPDGYSCSGLWNWILTGSHAETGRGTYAYHAGSMGLAPGPGQIEIGVDLAGWGGPDGTHMAGDILGVSYESTTSAGVHHGNGARAFGSIFHLGAADDEAPDGPAPQPSSTAPGRKPTPQSKPGGGGRSAGVRQRQVSGGQGGGSSSTSSTSASGGQGGGSASTSGISGIFGGSGARGGIAAGPQRPASARSAGNVGLRQAGRELGLDAMRRDIGRLTNALVREGIRVDNFGPQADRQLKEGQVAGAHRWGNSTPGKDTINRQVDAKLKASDRRGAPPR